ncbi:hypothetical protein [Anaerobacillus sp. 1_MG-2023]|uniref:hypothetical protein n=1 Tax=Anaerobacillus sp. 1_MG-2023 TaxID=3062655 RepID=UPI0026E227AB|nr:hypothetical protein [Anaerobacillus sp. 1_MG-2023]MDO6657219.1 hypothetical protein [Anaerobacillus sp. 1_MG-2023]
MKRIAWSVVLLLLITSGCGTASNTSPDTTFQSGEGSGEVNEQKEDQNLDLSSYRPDTGVTKTFTSQKKPMFTEYIVDQNEEYLQRVITLGDMKTAQVIKWTEDRAAIVEQRDSSNKESMLDEFEAVEEVETILLQPHNEEEIEITLLDTVEVPYGEFDHVLKVSGNQGDEVEITTYYAEGVGMIKQVYEMTGDQPESEVAELATIQ